MPTLAELIYALELTAKYQDLSKATDADLEKLARHCKRAAQVFNSAPSSAESV